MAPPGTQGKFVEGNLFRHITVMALTSSVGLMAIFVVDLVNIIFISMLGQQEFTAAVGYAGAILFFTTSFGIGLSIAVSALCARAVGLRWLAQKQTRRSGVEAARLRETAEQWRRHHARRADHVVV